MTERRALRVLIVEDTDDDEVLLLRALRRGGIDPIHERVQTAEGLAKALDAGTWDVVLSDFHLPLFSAPEAFRLVQSKGVDVPFIIVSGTVGEAVAVEAMKLGIHDYVMKDNLARLVPAIEREVRDRAVRHARKEAETATALAAKTLHETEERLRQSQKMEAVGSLAGGVAHDFNNLLSVILSYTSFVLEELEPESPLRDDLEEIQEAGRRAAELTRQLLAFGRRQVLQPRILDVGQTILGMEKMLRRLVPEDVEFQVRIAPGLWKVHADPGQIEQVLMNLVVNAKDAMPSGGTLTLEACNAELPQYGAREHPGLSPLPYVNLIVSDTGAGMDQETQRRMFEPFFTTKGVGKGTGLGLATVFGIVKQSGGDITVESELGRGTAMRIHLPRVDGEAARPSSSAPPPATLRGTETILVVEDEAQVRAVTTSILRRMGYVVLEAQNAGEALLICEKHETIIHLLVTDVVMPRMGGRELAERVAPMRPGMKVLYVSGYTDDTMLQHGVLDSELAFLPKPITPEALTWKVREVLDAD